MSFDLEVKVGPDVGFDLADMVQPVPLTTYEHRRRAQSSFSQENALSSVTYLRDSLFGWWSVLSGNSLTKNRSRNSAYATTRLADWKYSNAGCRSNWIRERAYSTGTATAITCWNTGTRWYATTARSGNRENIGIAVATHTGFGSWIDRFARNLFHLFSTRNVTHQYRKRNIGRYAASPEVRYHAIFVLANQCNVPFSRNVRYTARILPDGEVPNSLSVRARHKLYDLYSNWCHASFQNVLSGGDVNILLMSNNGV
ncbi:hypothetical protein OGAPHI_006588 [Ogataea philodendri]|uniref:Uncharacterized protein n=1 Tax=Ogataea philodendri TaxID=1378263 RepID=A0A9P8NXT6_9ASCO|nr:uncharacterized protein OGAPHI_006588 [Ogataea philodendri]KAH3661181.1 hypothetical protein OGAPHI_006588 [Ogataea philodendri]